MFQYLIFEIGQLLENLHEKKTQEEKMQEEIEGLKESLKAGKQSLLEVSSDRDRLRSLCDEKDKALQVKVLTSENVFYFICVIYLSP